MAVTRIGTVDLVRNSGSVALQGNICLACPNCGSLCADHENYAQAFLHLEDDKFHLMMRCFCNETQRVIPMIVVPENEDPVWDIEGLESFCESDQDIILDAIAKFFMENR